MVVNQLGEAVQRKVDLSSHHGWADWVELELHRGNDAKVPAAAAKAPEQVAILGFASREQIAIRSDNCGRLEAVAAKPDFAM